MLTIGSSMKNMILSLVLVAFAFAPALQAGDDKASSKPKSSCPMQEATCPMQKSSCCSDAATSVQPKSCCAQVSASAAGAKKARVVRRMDVNLKGAQLLVQK